MAGIPALVATIVATVVTPLAAASAALALAPLMAASGGLVAQDWDLAREVTIRRTDYGVPHILAPTLAGAAFGLAYAESEDHGSAVFEGLVRARGHLALMEGTAANVESDFARRQTHAWATATYPELDARVREVMEGFARGVKHYLALHPDEAPVGVDADFTGVDVHAMTIGWYDAGRARRFVRDLVGDPAGPPEPLDHPDDGSNAWALAPGRTTSGSAILLRNPHLAWDAGYYEAHLRVPGELDFYGDFRIGGLFGIIAGFNPWLGWATTNNAPDLSVVYRLERDPAARASYLLDGASHPIMSNEVTVQVRDTLRFASTGGIGEETRTFRTTDLGPLIHEDDSGLYVIRSADYREFRRGEQLFLMASARSLGEWKDAMRQLHISASNYTYADRDGNIFYVWNAKLPRLPHAYSPDSAVWARSAADVWSDLVAWDSLPQLANPPRGYVRNENDPPYFTNLDAIMDRGRFPENLPEPRLRLRSQHSLSILHNDRRFTLQDVVEAKHSMGMLLAERVKEDLVAAVRVGDASPSARAAAGVLDAWDNTASRDSRGSVLFKLWWDEYTSRVDTSEVFLARWDPNRPTDTPRGLGRPRVAAAAFEAAVLEVLDAFGRVDVTWGEARRVRRGGVDAPVGGCSGQLGCFRVLSFAAEEGAWVANRGDGWVLAVEFGDIPRAYSVLAYGQSSREASPHHADQAVLFADNRMKPVAFTEQEIERRLLRSYHPGEEPSGREPR